MKPIVTLEYKVMKLNQERYIRYWIVVVITSTLISLMACTPVAEVYDEPMYLDGGCFTQSDTIINSDTLYHWIKDK